MHFPPKMDIASEYRSQCSTVSLDSVSWWSLLVGSLIRIALLVLASASASAGAARSSGSSGVGVSGGNLGLAVAVIMISCGLQSRKRIATSVEACGGENSPHHFA